ncbi:MAG: glycosyltransferase family 4 protein [Leptolyngbyaceae cyanobacterium SM1_1_3]|nr:glycosyltransferase family 4 protein [Leptolyngbyaceae cyanobacterium SM1_1_3]NJO08548.1 glycosyltransferase family 4 protein [Leptolyngbyaceae cyanobacterium SL_1_1]
MKTIALVETNYGNGHHLTYLRLFSQILLEQQCQVMAFHPRPRDLTDWIDEHCPDYRDRLWVFEMHKHRRRRVPILGTVPEPVAVIERWQHLTNTLAEASEETGFSPDLVFLNWLDNYLSHYLTHHVIDYVFPYSWSGIYFRPGVLRFGQRSFAKLSEPLAHYSLARSPRCQALTMLNEELVEDLQQDLGKPVIAFPDITDETPPEGDYALVQKIRQKAGDRKIVGLIGALSKRKGILTLLKVAQQSMEENWFFVFAGQLDESMFHQEFDQRFPEEFQQIKKMREDPPDNCYFHFESIPDGHRFNSVVNACDVLFAAYENFPYSSNLLTKAAVFKKPIIVSEGYCMAARVEKFRFGLTIPEGDVAKCIATLRYLCDQPEQALRELNPDFEGYHRLHSIDQIRKVFQAVISNTESPLVTV